MKFIIKTNELKAGINMAAKALPSSTTMPILECFLLEAEDNNLTITANNHEVAIQTNVPCILQDEGKVCIDGKLLSKIVNSNPDEEMMFVTDDKYQTAVRSRTMRFDLPGRSGEDFSLLPKVEEENTIYLQREDFKDAISKTSFCSKGVGSNLALAGITLKVMQDKLSFLATDGFRMAKKVINLQQDFGKDVSLLLPLKTVNDVASIIKDEGELQISFTKFQCLFKMDQTLIVSRVYDHAGMREIPRIPDVLEVSFNKNDMLNALSNALLLEQGKPTAMVMTFEPDNIVLNYVTSMGKWKGKIPCTCKGDDSLRIGMNSRHVISVLKVLPEEKVLLHFAGATSPTYFEGDDYHYLIMPMMLV